ncbi:MAG: SRPBCC domain-containing protein, partial [Armatimonadota bacterium]
PTWEGETEVEVRFAPEKSGTRVDVEHRGFERLGVFGPDAAAKFRGGWPRVVRVFADYVSGRP